MVLFTFYIDLDLSDFLSAIIGSTLFTILLTSFFIISIYIFGLIKYFKNIFRLILKISFKIFRRMLSFKTLIILNMLAIIAGGALVYKTFQKLDTRLVNIENKFGGNKKTACTDEETKNKLSKNVFRIIGSFGEGSGFPISTDSIITSFHVIEGEASPKVVFPDGSIETPTKIKGIKDKDYAILTVDRKLSPLEFLDFDKSKSFNGLMIGEPLYAFGYPLGSTMKGDPSVIKGFFAGGRWLAQVNMNVVEANIGLVEGMSGGPLVDSCGKVVGINTMGIGGISMFLNLSDVIGTIDDLSSEQITQIKIDTSSPEGVVKAFYTYVKARNLRKAFDLISSARRSSVSSFEEWTNGYANTLQVNLITTEIDKDDKNKVKIKIESQDWIDGDMVYKYFEGTWEVIEENGEYQLNDSVIKQVIEPNLWWFYPKDEDK